MTDVAPVEIRSLQASDPRNVAANTIELQILETTLSRERGFDLNHIGLTLAD
jgi:hypothetical protein